MKALINQRLSGHGSSDIRKLSDEHESFCSAVHANDSGQDRCDAFVLFKIIVVILAPLVTINKNLMSSTSLLRCSRRDYDIILDVAPKVIAKSSFYLS